MEQKQQQRNTNHCMLWSLWLADAWPYLVCGLTLLVVGTHFGLRAACGFWLYQPMLLAHQRWWMWSSRPLCTAKEAAKFADHKTVHTTLARETEAVQRQRIAQLFFAPLSEAQMWSVLDGTSAPSLVTCSSLARTRCDTRTQQLISDTELTSCCTARSVGVWLSGEEHRAMWVEGATEARLLTTHFANQAQLLPEVALSVLWCSGSALPPAWVVPFCRFQRVRFAATTWRQPPPLSGEYKLLPITATNCHVLVDFVVSMKDHFDAVVLADVGNLVAQLTSRVLHVVAVVCDEVFQSVYVFRRTGFVDSCTQLELVGCVASLCRCDATLFVAGFKNAFWSVAAQHGYGGCELDEVAHNGSLIAALRERTVPQEETSVAMYFHGAAVLPCLRSGQQLLPFL